MSTADRMSVSAVLCAHLSLCSAVCIVQCVSAPVCAHVFTFIPSLGLSVCLSVCARFKVFASVHTETLFSFHLLPPHLHEGDVVEKRADSGGFKPHLLVNGTFDGAKEEAERQK